MERLLEELVAASITQSRGAERSLQIGRQGCIFDRPQYVRKRRRTIERDLETHGRMDRTNQCVALHAAPGVQRSGSIPAIFRGRSGTLLGRNDARDERAVVR